jgi:polar amino acid transport system permease protein
MRLSGAAPLAAVARGYSTVFRAIPELLMILILFYLGTAAISAAAISLGFGRVELNGSVVAVLVLGTVQGAYASEILRAAILAVPPGQIEAARAFGMERAMVFRRVTLPAMAPLALAGMANLWVTLIKDSALVSVVGTNELMFTAKQAAGSTRQYMTYYLSAAALYYIVTLASNQLIRRLETRLRRGMTEGRA